MEVLGIKRAGTIAFYLIAMFLVVATTGCGRDPRFPNGHPVEVIIPAHSERTHASVSLPVLTANGDRLVVNGNKFTRLSPENEIVHETVLALYGDTPYAGNYPDILSDALGNLYLYLGASVAGINSSGEIQWSTETPYRSTMLFPPTGGILFNSPTGFGQTVTMIGSDGEKKWQHSPIFYGSNTPIAIDHDNIYTMRQNKLLALDWDGVEVWSVPVEGSTVSNHWLSCLDGLVLVSGSTTLFAYDSNGTELWSKSIPPDFILFRNVLVLAPDRIVVQVVNGSPMRNGVLLLDGSGNQVAFFDQNYSTHFDTTDGAEFVSREIIGNEQYVCLHSLETGELLWRYQMPNSITYGTYNEAGVMNWYRGQTAPTFSSNGLIYFEVNSTLYELDKSGNLTWSLTSTVIKDEWFEERIEYN